LELEVARFSKTMTGETVIFDKEGYQYLKNAGNKKKQAEAVNVWWRCEYKSKSRGGCPGNCFTKGLFIKSKKGTHNHKPGEPVLKF
jgi:hypothetical protein